MAIGQHLTQANRYVAESLAKAIKEKGWQSNFPAEKLASLLNGLLLGYFAIELTVEENSLWERQEDFLDSLVELFLQGAIAPRNETSSDTGDRNSPTKVEIVADLPGNIDGL